MTPDQLLKRYFWVLVLGLVAALAYFQASAANRLIAAALGPDAKKLTAGPRARPDFSTLRGDSNPRRQTSAEAILDRNPFDSVTGPLKPVLTPADLPDLPPGELDLSDPLGAPPCDGVQVGIITESTDPVWSIAAIRGSDEPAPKIRRVGDQVSGKQVAYIGFNPREGSPAVWMTSGSTLCQAVLFSGQPEAPAPAPKAAQPVPGTKPGRAKGGKSKIAEEISKQIQKVSDTEFNVDRAVVDKVLENQAELMKSARIVPEKKNGQVVGIRMFGVRPGSLLSTLGFQNGDRLDTINGFNMASPEKALEAYARLRTASNLNVKINRRGKPVSIDFRIK